MDTNDRLNSPETIQTSQMSAAFKRLDDSFPFALPVSMPVVMPARLTLALGDEPSHQNMVAAMRNKRTEKLFANPPVVRVIDAAERSSPLPKFSFRTGIGSQDNDEAVGNGTQHSERLSLPKGQLLQRIEPVANSADNFDETFSLSIVELTSPELHVVRRDSQETDRNLQCRHFSMSPFRDYYSVFRDSINHLINSFDNWVNGLAKCLLLALINVPEPSSCSLSIGGNTGVELNDIRSRKLQFRGLYSVYAFTSAVKPMHKLVQHEWRDMTRQLRRVKKIRLTMQRNGERLTLGMRNLAKHADLIRVETEPKEVEAARKARAYVRVVRDHYQLKREELAKKVGVDVIVIVLVENGLGNSTTREDLCQRVKRLRRTLEEQS